MPLHQFTNGLQLGYGIQPVNPVPVDSYSGPYAAGTTTDAVALANATIPAALRFLSLEVRILAPYEGATLAYKYWYRGSTANDGLVEFSSASSSSSSTSGVTQAVAGAGIVLSPAGGTGTVTFINNGVLSFNGNTGAVTGASLGANTFTASQTISGSSASLTVTNTNNTATSEYTSSGINVSSGPASQTILYGPVVPGNTVTFPAYTTVLAGLAGTQTFSGTNTFTAISNFNAGITTASIYSSTGSTFAGTLKVVGGATFDARVDVGGVLEVAGGVTLEQTLNVISVAKFHSNVSLGDESTDTVTATGTFQGLTVSNGLLIANAGITTAFLYASAGSTFGGTLKVIGGATFDSTTDHAGVARFAAGLTTSALDVTGTSKFNGNITLGDAATDTITATGTFQGLTVSDGLLTANAGITTSSIYASAGSTFGGTLRVNGFVTLGNGLWVSTGATLGAGVDVSGTAKFNGNVTVGDNSTDVLTVTSGATFGITDHSGIARFAAGLTTSTLDVVTISNFAGGATFASSANFAVGLTSSGDVVVGSAGTVLKTNGDVTIGATLTVNGNFFVAGTLTTVNQTTLQIDDKTITLGRTLDNDDLASGGGLILNANTDRTLLWNSDSDAWTSSVNYNVTTGYGYKINNTTALASGMVHGLSASAGIITGGTWAANLIGLTYGGTNKNLAAVGASGGIVYKDGTGLTITAAGTVGQILQANSNGAPVWVNTTSLTGLTADRVKTTATNTAGTYYLTFVTAAADSTDLYVDTTTGVTYDAASGVLSCVQLEALVDGGVF
jgi:hypothetical protein